MGDKLSRLGRSYIIVYFQPKGGSIMPENPFEVKLFTMITHIGDYLSETQILKNATEHGMYHLLCIYFFQTGHIPDDLETLKTIVKFPRGCKDSSLMNVQSLFKLVGSHQITRQRAKALANIEKRRKAGRLSGIKRNTCSTHVQPTIIPIYHNTNIPNKTPISPLDKTRQVAPSSLLDVLPENFCSDEIKKAIEEFTQHRKEIKKPITNLSLRKIINKYKNKPPQEFIDAINYSIEKGWQGVFDPPPEYSNGKFDRQKALQAASERFISKVDIIQHQNREVEKKFVEKMEDAELSRFLEIAKNNQPRRITK